MVIDLQTRAAEREALSRLAAVADQVAAGREPTIQDHYLVGALLFSPATSAVRENARQVRALLCDGFDRAGIGGAQ